MPSTNTQIGFGFDSTRNTIYIKNSSEKVILKYNGNLKKILQKTTLQKISVWKRRFSDYLRFKEVIVFNPVTNTVYVSDSKRNFTKYIVRYD